MNLMKLLGVKAKAALGGRYKLIQPLGQGGFGHTFLATDLHLPDHPTCVIKQLKPHLQDTESLTTARRLFETEARVLYLLGEHSQIPRLLAHFEDHQEFYLAQELIEGETLSDLIRPGCPWSEVRVRQLLIEILTPLAFVHEQGVIHRDLKPSNLIHRHIDNQVVLIDFGAVKQVSEQRIHSHNHKITRTISIGTQGYMPSEQLAGNPWFSSDIYAVGMICLQALTGTAPHLLKREPHTSEVLWQSPDLDISEDFKAILTRMVRYDFRERYPTATAALTDLQALSALPSDPIVRLSGEFPTLPTQVVAPGRPSSSMDRATVNTESSDQGHGAVASKQTSSTQTLAVEALGLPVLSQSLHTLTKATAKVSAAATPTLSSNAHKSIYKSRWSMMGLSALVVIALGLLRHYPISSQPESQSVQSATQSAQPAETEILVVEAGPESLPVIPSSNNELPDLSPVPSVELESSPASPVNKIAIPAENSVSPEPVIISPGVSPVNESVTPGVNVDPSSDALSVNHSIDALLAEANQLRDRNQYNEALQLYDQLLEQNPEQADGHWGQCYSLNQLQDYKSAIEACDRALVIIPNHIQSLLSKGYALEQQGQPDAALVLYDQILAIAPDYTDAWNNRGGIMFQQQRFQEALAAFDRARELNPGLATAWSNRGAALWELRQFDEAISSIDKALELQPDYSEAQALRTHIRQSLAR